MTTTSADVPTVELNNGVEIPQFGFGVFQVPAEETADTRCRPRSTRVTATSIPRDLPERGGVGACDGRGWGLPRDEVFITTKLWNDDHGYDTRRRDRREPGALGLDHVDLYLIHWPSPDQDRLRRRPGRGSRSMLPRAAPARSASRTSRRRTCERVAAETGTVPAVNQIELHPRTSAGRAARLPRPARHRHRGVEPARAGPTARRPGGRPTSPRRTAAPRPRSCCAGTSSRATSSSRSRSTPERIAENIDVFDFELSDEEMAAIGGLDACTSHRTGPGHVHGVTAGFPCATSRVLHPERSPRRRSVPGMTTNAYLSFLAIGVALVLMDGQVIYRSGRRYLGELLRRPGRGCVDDPAGHGAVPPGDAGGAGADLRPSTWAAVTCRHRRAASACCC